MFSVLNLSPSEVRAWHKDEENTKRHGDCCKHEERHSGACSEKPCNKRLSNSRPVHEGVFAEAEESHDQVELVLVADQEVGADCKWQDELQTVSWCFARGCCQDWSVVSDLPST
jgi:hypothetical protein